MSKRVIYENNAGMRLVGLMDFPKGFDPKTEVPGVVLCHHFAGFKEVKHLSHLADYLASKGYAVLRFDFANCVGESDGSCKNTRLDHQNKDLISTLDFVSNYEGIDSSRIGVAGHSLGATTVIKTAAVDKRIKCVVPIAPVAKFKWQTLLDETAIAKWMKEGEYVFRGPKGPIDLDYSYYHDLVAFDGVKEVKNIKVPICFIHGSEDKITPLLNSERMYETANNPKRLNIIDGADHMFSNKVHENFMMVNTWKWFDEHL